MSERSALVTGASTGIGLGVATRLARRGFGLTITARTGETLEAVAEQLVEDGARDVVVVASDAAVADSQVAVVAAHHDRFAAMDALVVNAGVVATSLAPAFVDTDMSAWAHGQVSPEDMIPVSDVLDVVEMLIGLSSNTMISRIVMGRSGTSGFVA
jgi:short-subunit dehydrogenase